MERIHRVTAEVIDVDGRSTVRVTVATEHGFVGQADLPAGISVGANEAQLVPPARAVRTITSVVAPALVGADVLEQRVLDETLMELDGSEHRSKLGANSLLPVSLAAVRAAAAGLGRALYVHLAELADATPAIPKFIQVIIEGGAHGSNGLTTLQECSVIGTSADGVAVLAAVAERARAKQIAPSVGPEGGWRLPRLTNEAALELLESAIKRTGRSLPIAIDVAASHHPLKPATLEGLLERFPISVVEDPIDQTNLPAWATFTKDHPTLVVAADDCTAGDPRRIKDAVRDGVANALVLKLNQTATLSELLDLVSLARIGGWQIIVSHRGHETMDPFIADLAVGLAAPYLKTGTTTRPDRKVKHDRIAAIASELAGPK